MKGRIPFSEMRPDLVSEWYYARNCGFGPEDFSYGSHVEVWWRCPIYRDHVYRMRIMKRGSRGDGCPYCGKRKVSPTNSLGKLYPALVPEWHPSRNGDVTPFDVVAGSAKAYWWRCSKGHCWKAQLSNRTQKNTGCPRCFVKGRKKMLEEVLQARLPLSRSSIAAVAPHLKRQWHPTKNGALTPDMVRPSDGRRVWWQCESYPKHVWTTLVRSRQKGSGCPFCLSMGPKKRSEIAPKNG